MASEIITEIRLVLDDFKKSLKEAESHGAESGKTTGEGFGKGVEEAMAKPFAAIRNTLLEIGAVFIAGFTFDKAIEKAMEMEDAGNRIAQAFRIAGQNQEALNGFNEYAESLSRVTSTSKEVIQTNAALMVSLGKLKGDQLEQATKAALDLAAGLHIGPEAAFNALTKAAEGNFSFLNRWRIQVVQTGDHAKDFASALTRVNAMFGGMASGQLATFSGVMQRLKNDIGDLAGELGQLVTRSPIVVAIVKSLTEWFRGMADAVHDFGKGRDVFGDYIKSLLDFGHAVVTYVVAPIEFMYNIGRLAFHGLQTAIQQMIVDVVGAMYGLGVVLAKVMPDRFTDFRNGAKAALDSTSAVLHQFENQTQQSLSQAFDFNKSQIADRFVTRLQGIANSVAPIGRQMVGNLVRPFQEGMPPAWSFIENGFNRAFGRTRALSIDFQQEMQHRVNAAFDSFKVGFASSFASIGEALVKHENAFAAFGKAILGVFGDLAIQIGTFYFMLGLANVFLDPAAAAVEIAGGLALIVVGGALKALSGGAGLGGGAGAAAGGGGGGGGSGGGGYSGGGIASSDYGTGGGQVAAASQGPSVEINVAGNILDRRQTGLELVEVMNDAFNTNGVNLRTT